MYIDLVMNTRVGGGGVVFIAKSMYICLIPIKIHTTSDEMITKFLMPKL
jgi:hypothetical protein